jgi:hypothetical protein
MQNPTHAAGRPAGTPKTGGRMKGTPNRRTRDVFERLEALDCDPIEGMARIAMNPQNRPELRGRMFAELAQYVYPKRKALEVAHERTTGQYTFEELVAATITIQKRAENAGT